MPTMKITTSSTIDTVATLTRGSAERIPLCCQRRLRRCLREDRRRFAVAVERRVVRSLWVWEWLFPRAGVRGAKPLTLTCSVVPACPPGPALVRASATSWSLEHVADAPRERPDRFFLGLAFGELAFIERAAGRVAVTDLGDRRDVDRMVELAVAAQGEPMHDAPAGRHLDRGGAVVGRELGAVAEPADVTGVTDGDGGTDGPEPEQLRD